MDSVVWFLVWMISCHKFHNEQHFTSDLFMIQQSKHSSGKHAHYIISWILFYLQFRFVFYCFNYFLSSGVWNFSSTLCQSIVLQYLSVCITCSTAWWIDKFSHGRYEPQLQNIILYHNIKHILEVVGPLVLKYLLQFFASRFDVIISEIQSSSGQTTYGGGDHTSTYRIPSGPSTSKASQQSGGSNVGADAAQLTRVT